MNEMVVNTTADLSRLLEQCQNSATQLLNAHSEELDRISAYLLERESITGAEFMALLKKENPKIFEAE